MAGRQDRQDALSRRDNIFELKIKINHLTKKIIFAKTRQRRSVLHRPNNSELRRAGFFLSSYLLIFLSSYLLIFLSSYLLIFLSSSYLTFSPSHLLTFSPSHLLIFFPSYLLPFFPSSLISTLRLDNSPSEVKSQKQKCEE